MKWFYWGERKKKKKALKHVFMLLPKEIFIYFYIYLENFYRQLLALGKTGFHNFFYPFPLTDFKGAGFGCWRVQSKTFPVINTPSGSYSVSLPRFSPFLKARLHLLFFTRQKGPRRTSILVKEEIMTAQKYKVASGHMQPTGWKLVYKLQVYWG